MAEARLTSDGKGDSLDRRRFLATTLATSAFSTVELARPQTATPGSSNGKPRQYYELRTYSLRSGRQSQITGQYVSSALIPALNRLGITPVGAFNLTIGPDTPTLYLLLPCDHLDVLANAELRLRQDQQFLAAADAFWNAPEESPAFERVESTLLIAFEGWPQLVLPPPAARHGKRIFQMRTYESASDRDHLRKVQMFHSGEFEIFERSGFWRVFFGDALIGPRLPRLTYMLSFSELKELDDLWDKFRDDPQWKKLTASKEFNFEPIVSSVTNLILSPTEYSQI
ncbi:MAG TPA: NIPSNAP family protein [Terracidiphilus sp.]|nr:NIPSNAP family protein [Terracidiphilus sp.]